MKRVTRLTERDLTRIVKRIIKESEMEDSDEFDFEELDFEDMGDNENELSQEEVIPLIAQFFKQEVLSENHYRNRRRLRENKKRGSKFAERALTGAGVGSMLGGLTGVIGSASGWTDTMFQQKIHDFIESLGMGTYSGPISIAMIVAGAMLALGGSVAKYNRKEREKM